MADTPIQYRVKNKNQPGPNCLWEIKRADLGFVGTGNDFPQLANNCAAWRKANGIPIGLGFDDELENVLADKYMASCPEGFFTDDPRAPIRIKSLGWGDVLRGSEVMISTLVAGSPVVDRAEADRRANICVNCRFNVQFVKPCGGICGALKTLAKKIVGNQTTSQQGKLNSCFICRCFLEPAVWLPLDIQVKPLSEHQKIQFEGVAHCWKKASLISVK